STAAETLDHPTLSGACSWWRTRCGSCAMLAGRTEKRSAGKGIDWTMLTVRERSHWSQTGIFHVVAEVFATVYSSSLDLHRSFFVGHHDNAARIHSINSTR